MEVPTAMVRQLADAMLQLVDLSSHKGEHPDVMLRFADCWCCCGTGADSDQEVAVTNPHPASGAWASAPPTGATVKGTAPPEEFPSAPEQEGGESSDAWMKHTQQASSPPEEDSAPDEEDSAALEKQSARVQGFVL